MAIIAALLFDLASKSSEARMVTSRLRTMTGETTSKVSIFFLAINFNLTDSCLASTENRSLSTSHKKRGGDSGISFAAKPLPLQDVAFKQAFGKSTPHHTYCEGQS
jgi:hypothetical protein